MLVFGFSAEWGGLVFLVSQLQNDSLTFLGLNFVFSYWFFAGTQHRLTVKTSKILMTPTEKNQEELKQTLTQLRLEHRDLDAAISALLQTGISDMLQLQRLKKKKLLLRDKITVLEGKLVPDIIA